MAKERDGVKAMNLIRETSTDSYRAAVPVATANNLQEVGNPILKYSTVMNEFLNALVNRIALTIITNRIYRNPLAVLKSGNFALGADVQEIYTNPAKAVAYDIDATTELLARTPPDVKAAYHRMNRQDQYPVTISNQALRKAFTSWGELENLLASIVNSLYSGDNIDEFKLMKSLFGTAINSGYIVTQELPGVVNSRTGAEDAVLAIKTAIGAMQFPGSNYNSYVKIATAQGVAKPTPVVTWTPLDQQMLIIRADVLARIDVQVLAAAYNLSKVEFMGMIVPIDSFGATGAAARTVAIAADKAWTKVYDNLQEMTEFYNAKSMSWNYYWNHWQTYSYSPFVNAVAFVEPEPEPITP